MRKKLVSLREKSSGRGDGRITRRKSDTIRLSIQAGLPRVADQGQPDTKIHFSRNWAEMHKLLKPLSQNSFAGKPQPEKQAAALESGNGEAYLEAMIAPGGSPDLCKYSHAAGETTDPEGYLEQREHREEIS